MAQEKQISKVLAKLEYGIYVVTMGKGEEGNALTISWLAQVSSDPPMVMVAIKNSHQSARMLTESDYFAVNLLSVDQVEIAKAYYGPAESGYDKLKGRKVSPAPVSGCPLVNGAVGYLDCKIVKSVPTGNHTVFIAEVLSAGLDKNADILSNMTANLRYSG